MVQVRKPNATADDIEAQIRTIREDVTKLTGLIMQLGEEKVAGARGKARSEAEEMLGRARKSADEAAGQAREKIASIEHYIVEKPVQSAFIALLAGIFIGSMSRR